MSTVPMSPTSTARSFAEIHAVVLAALRETPESTLLDGAQAVKLWPASGIGIHSIAALLDRVADLRDPLAPWAVSWLGRVALDRAWPLALELCAAAPAASTYEAAIRAELGKRAALLPGVASAARWFAWEPTDGVPPWRWPARPLAEAFPTPDALLAALDPRGPLDGLHVIALQVLSAAMPSVYGSAPGSVEALRLDEQLHELRKTDTAENTAAQARRVLNDAAKLMPLDVLMDAVRRGWLGLDANLDAIQGRRDLQSPEAALAALERVVGPTMSPGEVQRNERVGRWLIRELRAARHEPAIPVLSYLARACDRLLGEEALEALFHIGTERSYRALLDSIPALFSVTRVGPPVYRSIPVAVRAAIALDPGSSTRTLADYFDPARLEAREGRFRAEHILMASKPGVEADPRWFDVATSLLGGTSFYVAREFLSAFDPATVRAALARAGYKPPEPTAPRLHPLPAAPRWVERYEAGEHEAVWSEIAALEDSVRDGAVLDEAAAVARSMMTRVRTNLERIVEALKKRKYAFAAGSAKKAFPGPSAKAGKELAAIEELLGGPLPLSLRAFYEVVGSVDLTEVFDAKYDDKALFFSGYGQFDPIVVFRPAATLEILRPRVAAEERHLPELRRPIKKLEIGTDPAHKAAPTNPNDWTYSVEVQGTAADGLLRQGDRSMPFVDYLRAVLRSGGFLALADQPHERVWRQREALTKDVSPF
ncbi:hypothetical protein [Sorangium sp. So ce145]|uniref:hypothetical protein n=1 Tax=Sorangium sp. So ce145 TaxID=3133285 RepID=UPI003F5E60F2